MSRMEYRNYRSSAQLVHCNINQKRYNHFPISKKFTLSGLYQVSTGLKIEPPSVPPAPPPNLWGVRIFHLIKLCTISMQGNPRSAPQTAYHSPIHKAAVQNGVWRSFCTAVFFDILGIIPGKPVERP